MTKTATDVALDARLVAEVLDGLPADCPLPTHIQIHAHDMKPSIAWLLFEMESDAAATIARDVFRTIGGDWDEEGYELRCLTQWRDGVELRVSVAMHCDLLAEAVA